ncbi:MAG TPA: metal ABC transporter permease [Miltoncostaeaceae bacterium]|nr:metal ABC transporter permease [Miltoncostaeaceae bacterium]
MARAGIELVLVGLVGGVLGTFVVLRGLAFTADAFAHCALPGAVVALALGGSIAGGALAAGLVSAGAVVAAGRARATNADTAVGVVFFGLFALGAVLFARLGPFDRDLSSFIFGSVLGVTWREVATTAVAGALVVGILLRLWRPLVLATFDQEAAAGAGVRTGRLDAALLVAIALAVVAAVGAVGNVLVVALLVTPAATARVIARRLVPTVLIAVAAGTLAAIGGLYLSYYAGVAAGGSVVLVATGMLAVALVASPRSGAAPAVRRAFRRQHAV